MAEELKRLIHRRGQIKSRLTRFRLYLDDNDQDFSEFQLSSRIARLRECWAEFDSIQTEIEIITTESKSQTEAPSEREMFEECYFELETRFAARLKTGASTFEDLRARANTSLPGIQLPVLNLPTFRGSYDEWVPFHDAFQSIIHSNTSLSPIQKLHYLKSSLKGDASHFLDNLELSDANYDVAWKLLKERYENKRIIITKHINEIMNSASMNKESISELRHLLDNTLKHIRALKALGQPTDQWDTLLIHIISHKLDSSTRRAWELTLTSNELPVFEDLISFLSHRCKILETSECDQSTNLKTQSAVSTSKRANNNHPQVGYSRKSSAYIATQPSLCPLCDKAHQLFQCNSFNKLTISERINKCRQLKVCMNCLRGGHLTINCKSASCKKCGKRHNTQLHLDQYVPEASASSQFRSESSTETCLHNVNAFQQVILSTAIINIADSGGQLHPCRALLDSGSQSNFITESLASALALKRTKICKPILGINQNISSTSHLVRTSINSRINAFTSELDFFVLPKITGDLPSPSIDWSSFHVPKNIQLADPHYYVPNRIDILIGAELFWRLTCVGQIRISNNLPILQKTILGWIISGKAPTKNNSWNTSQPPHCHLSTQDDSLEGLIKNFWNIEQVSERQVLLSEEEQACEEHFKCHTRRDASGRFIVRLPFLHDPSILGHSRSSALSRFEKLERRFASDPLLKDEYRKFINEYLELDHMEVLIRDNIKAVESTFYLPHHPVLKQCSSTTKLRVVFDGSAKSSTGISLNDILMVGPVVQQDLFSILLSFRTYAFAFITDIKQMYRQITLQSPDTNLQRIFWRDSPEDKLKTYCLSTVTYGLSSSSFLATRCLLQLAIDNSADYPRAAAALNKNCYVDDIITGASTIEEALKVQEELKNLLSSAGFQLHKWCANHPRLLEEVQTRNRESQYKLPDKTGDIVKTLGLQWQPENDYFYFTALPTNNKHQISKRIMLSEISRLFDPLGLLGPVIVKAKVMMQQLWQLKLDWDESIPADIHTEWIHFRNQLLAIQQLRIPRSVIPVEGSTELQIHGFCDASEVAYGACIYTRCVHNKGEVKVRLVCAKSRVAPLKKITVPRLELCGALLLAQLIDKINSHFNSARYFLWTDSTIVLAWLSSHPKNWKTFVANRVNEIQELTANMKWGHVSSSENPADILSRGSLPLPLIHSKTWWSGPDWLGKKKFIPSHTSNEDKFSAIELERKAEKVIIHVATEGCKDIYERFSSFSKLKRVTAYCLRFAKNARRPQMERNKGALALGEIHEAFIRLIKATQIQHFGPELSALMKAMEIPPKSSLSSLNPFLDKEGVIRVGGRLMNSQLSYHRKHPIVLPKNSFLTELIMSEFHLTSLHSGPQALLYETRQFFWPIHGKKLALRIVRNCLKCFKARPTASSQLMGQLPPNRVIPNRAFDCVGIDYFGPVWYKRVQQRRSPPVKGYVALFVCLSSKAIHLELVTDQTTATFLAALRRFMARRGKPNNIYSDNAMNFVGARNELAELRKLFMSDQHKREVSQHLADENVTWHFIPPHSPHFGGLWEAGVKSTKHHLLRVIGNAILTYEELNTLIIQVEACVNSRPLTPMSNDPNDLMPLTPGHFLIGQPLNLMPEPDLIPIQVNRLSRWQYVQQLIQSFWRRWSSEYLSCLQQRSKWHIKSGHLKEGVLVLLTEDHLPPLKWKTGRVVELHPGRDGLSRVATVKTSMGLFKRPINKLCILPIS